MYMASRIDCRCIDGHAGGDPVQRDAVEQSLHIGQRADRDADLAHLAFGEGMVGVIAELRGQIKGNRQAGLPLGHQVLETVVAFLGGRIAGVLAHRPQASPVHGRVHATRIGILAGRAQIVLIVVACQVIRCVYRFDRDA